MRHGPKEDPVSDATHDPATAAPTRATPPPPGAPPAAPPADAVPTATSTPAPIPTAPRATSSGEAGAASSPTPATAASDESPRPEQTTEGDPADDGPLVLEAIDWAVVDWNPDAPMSTEVDAEGNPFNATLLLYVDEDQAVEFPLDPEIPAVQEWWDALAMVKDAQQDILRGEQRAAPGSTMSRVSGWHQINQFWDSSPTPQRIYIALGVVILILILALISR